MFLTGAGLLQGLQAQPKDYYKQVDYIVWVVKDVRATEDGWKNLGFTGVVDGEKTVMPEQVYKGTETEVSVLPGYLNMGGVMVTLIQPLGGVNAYTDYLKKYGEGPMVLMHRVPEGDELENETGRLGAAGVKVLQRGNFQTRGAEISYVFFDTKKEGKYILGIYTSPEPSHRFLETPNDMNLKFNQFAFAIKNPAKVSAFWQKLGFPKMEVTHTDTWGKQYYGKPADFDMKLGWQRHGKIVYEWCIPLKPPTIYADYIKTHGEGIQHFGMACDDIDKAIAFMIERGFAISQSGGWGEEGKPGSGRFAYVNLESVGGGTIELLWSYPE